MSNGKQKVLEKFFKITRFSVKKQFFIINVLMVVFGIGLSSLTVLIVRKLERSQSQIKNVSFVAIQASRISGLLSEKGDAIKSLLIDSTNNLEKERKKKADDALVSALDEMYPLAKKTALEGSLKKLSEFSLGTLKSNENEILQDIFSGRKSEANNKYVTMYSPTRQILNKMTDEFALAAQKLADDRVREISERVIWATKFILVLQIVGVLFAVSVLFMIGRSLVGRLQKIASQLVETSHNIRQNTTSQRDQAQELSREMVDAATALRSTASAAEQMNSILERNAEMAEGSKRLSEQGQKTVAQGHDAVEDVLISIQNIHNNNQQIGQQVDDSFKDLERVSGLFKSIYEKTLSINGIVLQTRLLSFNASVEASRAGEHGRGFAVVAEEIGKLAQASGTAAKEIEELLKSSTAQVDDVIGSVRGRLKDISNSSEQKVHQGTVSAERCRAIFNSIMTDVTQIHSRIGDIYESSKEQTFGVREITNSVRRVDGAIQKNTLRAQTGATQTQDIQNQSEVLKEVVGDMEKIVIGTTLEKAAS